MNDLPEHIKIERKGDDRGEIGEEDIVDMRVGHEIGTQLEKAVDEEENGEIPEIAFFRGKKEDSQAGDEGKDAEQEDAIVKDLY